METLKKLGLLFCLLLLVVSPSAQNRAERQNAFYKSYDAERSNKYSLAINELKKVYNAEDYFANIRLGWLHYLDKQHDSAKEYYAKAIKLKPYSIEARFGLIKPLSAQEDWAGVKEQYLEILKIDPQNTLANYWLGVIFYNAADYTQAEKRFEKVVNLYPLDYDSVVILGWTKLNLGKYQEAKVMFEHALTLKPGDESSLEGLKLIK
ncbi:MAG: tetratricopeptide repeat protein [Bacteroidales bacterium]|jgi:tetratricopeptide (TPR) repeat protein|nr:tetratricopeptide repeat protein [Bacteroidales bacterium]MDD4640973.1 tetratricopeptide repeat protein [Bacteroidales bacterium]NLB03664.1 tetratricopeptide repeat protein [Bacteroidales bacterium]